MSLSAEALPRLIKHDNILGLLEFMYSNPEKKIVILEEPGDLFKMQERLRHVCLESEILLNSNGLVQCKGRLIICTQETWEELMNESYVVYKIESENVDSPIPGPSVEDAYSEASNVRERIPRLGEHMYTGFEIAQHEAHGYVMSFNRNNQSDEEPPLTQEELRFKEHAEKMFKDKRRQRREMRLMAQMKRLKEGKTTKKVVDFVKEKESNS